MAAFTDEIHCLLLPYLPPCELLQLLLACRCALTERYRWELLRAAASRLRALQEQRHDDAGLICLLKSILHDMLMEHRALGFLGWDCTRWWLGPWSVLGETEQSITPSSAHLEEARRVLAGEHLDVLGYSRVHLV
jgi:hypothetical protein